MLEVMEGRTSEWEYEEEGAGSGAGEGGEGQGGEGAGNGAGAPPVITDDTEIEVNGEKITVKELREGHMRQSDYTKKMQEIADERKKLEGNGQPKKKEGESPFSEEDRKTAGILLEIALKDPELKEKYGLVTKAELAQNQFVQKLTAQAEGLSGEFDGKNGLPKFVEKDVLEHMQESGIRDMKKAYIDLHFDEYTDWLAKQKKGSTAYKSEGKGAPVVAKKKEYKPGNEGFKDKLGDIFDEMIGKKEE